MIRSSLSLVALVFCFAACSGSSGGGGPTAPEIPASVPDGSGAITIDMTGTWEIRNAAVIDTNSASPAPPLNGTVFEIDPQRIVSIGAVPVDPATLAIILNSPLVTYVNQVDGNTLFYGVLVDRRPSGGTREEVGVAGGALDADTIAVEAFTSTQGPSEAEPIFTLSRYLLVRVTPTAPATNDPEPVPADMLEAAFGRR